VYGLKEMVANNMSKIGDYFASQCGNPRGVIGKIMTWAMNRANHVMYKGIVDELKISPETKILDVGFGNGYLEKLIMQKSKCSITGIDISEDMVKKAAEANHKFVASGYMRFQLGDCCDLSFKDKSFDVVTTMNTIYFWSNTAKGMAEISRVLKDGGIFYNAVISKENLDKYFYTKNGFKKFSKDEYIELGKKAGFRRIRIKKLGNNYGLLIIYMK
jgi:ubiquinone/menaquinone biosynthesis C-methylase UbiE